MTAASRVKPEKWARKNMMIDQRKLDRVKAILKVSTETDAVNAALDMVEFQSEVLSGISRMVKAGGLKSEF